LVARFFWGRHAAIEDHALGQPDSCLHVLVCSYDVLNMGQALAGGILNAPPLPQGRPFDLRPQLPIDREG
jgi:hypothetical protein